ncbi:energy transducer TonB [Sphingobacterium sp. E70]|uniref:energy transducer TonB n=1 Tax=Sphingobacterium sp. E70 TaxID=2853439 RepID=UPI00211CAD46|nr:energy transducer TonB [Sphingobacterium sp. E70]ULT22388.1 energy transducer TonB [Sphingobacterium sp. E70]
MQVKKPIYIVYYDSLQNKTLENGNGRIRFNVEGKEEYEEGEIVNNLREGEWKGRAGQDSFVENYNQDRLLSGTLIKEDGAIIQYDSTTYKVNPEYPGGTYKMMTFVANNFDYPKEAMKNGVSGILEIGFVINKVGQVEDIKVKQDLGFGTGKQVYVL